MTTIAWDGFVLATDSLITNGSHIFGTGEKIHRLKNGGYLAAAGAQDLIYSVVAWLDGAEKPEIKDDDSFIGLIVYVDENGVVSADELSGKLRRWPACLPWAGGSGEAFALTAMKCGKDAIQAVEIACQMDIYSGGKINSLHDFDHR
jgi:ATP-dependent protease HslVU (ClpYQ) peptidase subunit